MCTRSIFTILEATTSTSWLVQSRATTTDMATTRAMVLTSIRKQIILSWMRKLAITTGSTTHRSAKSRSGQTITHWFLTSVA